jgi:hypothetical protein
VNLSKDGAERVWRSPQERRRPVDPRHTMPGIGRRGLLRIKRAHAQPSRHDAARSSPGHRAWQEGTDSATLIEAGNAARRNDTRQMVQRIASRFA